MAMVTTQFESTRDAIDAGVRGLDVVQNALGLFAHMKNTPHSIDPETLNNFRELLDEKLEQVRDSFKHLKPYHFDERFARYSVFVRRPEHREDRQATIDGIMKAVDVDEKKAKAILARAPHKIGEGLTIEKAEAMRKNFPFDCMVSIQISRPGSIDE